MNSEFDQIWANVTHELDGRLCRYLHLAEPYVVLFKDSGAISEHQPFVPKKAVKPKTDRKERIRN